MTDFLQVCEAAARAGGAILLDWAERFSVREKGPADLVTEADVASQTAIRRVVLDAFPEHDFLSEEDTSATARQSGYRWIVDPLDGTTNYVHHVPEYAVSIALERDGELLVGCVFNPVHGECYTAERNRGAFLNGRRLQTSGIDELEKALVAVSFPPRVRPDSIALSEFGRVIVRARALRRTGSTALNLCSVAAGRFDAYWARETKIWDVAAGWLMVHEAGGVVTNIDGSRCDLANPRFIAAGTEPLRRELQSLLDPTDRPV